MYAGDTERDEADFEAACRVRWPLGVGLIIASEEERPLRCQELVFDKVASVTGTGPCAASDVDTRLCCRR